MPETRQTSSYIRLMLWLLLVTIAIALLSLRYGSASLRFAQVWDGLFRQDPQSTVTQILWVVRLPHVAACLLAGAALAISGVLLQTAAGNPLAGPNIIGVNAGAGFAMVLGMCFAPMAYPLFPLMSFAGAFACSLFIVLISNKAGGSRVTIVLAGVAISTLFSAGISMLKLVYPDLAVSYHAFSVGGVSGITFDALVVPAIMVLLVLLVSLACAARLDLLCLGDSIAASLGVQAKQLRTLALLLASASAGAAVSFAGLLGFVGLMVPHIARKVTRSSNTRKLLLAAALLGGSMVTLADLLGRVLFAPSEVPAGIITAIIGAPFFFLLLLQRGNRL